MRSQHTPSRIVRVYIEALTGFSHIHGPDDVSSTELSKVALLGIFLCEDSGQHLHCKDRDGVMTQLPGFSPRIHLQSYPLNDRCQLNGYLQNEKRKGKKVHDHRDWGNKLEEQGRENWKCDKSCIVDSLREENEKTILSCVSVKRLNLGNSCIGRMHISLALKEKGDTINN